MLYKLEVPDIKEGETQIKADGINIQRMGYHVGAIEGWEVQDKDLPHLGLKFEKVDLQDKSIYRFPKLSLPRAKFDLLKEKYSCKLIRNKDNADAAIVSSKYINKLVSTNWYMSVDSSQLFKLLTQFKQADLLAQCAVDKFNDFFQDPEQFIPGCRIQVTSSYSYGQTAPENKSVTQIFKDWKEECEKARVKNNIRDVYIEDTEDLNNWLYMIDPSNTVYLDNHVMEKTNEGLAILPDEEFKNIKDMMTSDDRSTRTLCIEMLANCNLSESMNVIAPLYWWHYEYFKDTNNWNSVNVKAFREALKPLQGGHSFQNIWSYNQLIKVMSDRGQLTDFIYKHTRNLLYTQLLGTQVGPSSEMWTIDENAISLRPGLFKINEDE
mgnify:CR=1 FL=1